MGHYYDDHPRPEELADHRTADRVPVLDAYYDDSRDGLPMIGVLLTTLLFIVVVVGLWLIARSIDWMLILDFIAPTAARARGAGWVAVVEGL